MDKQELTPQESLRVIEEMIQKSQKRISYNGGMPGLVWGYTTFFTALLIYFLMPRMDYRVNFLWFIIPILGGAIYFTLRRSQKRQTLVKNHIDRTIDIIWIILGLNALVISFIGSNIILSIILILIGIGSSIMAFIADIKVYKVASIISMIAGYFILFVPIDPRSAVLYFGIAFLVTQSLPGHYLNYLSKKEHRYA